MYVEVNLSAKDIQKLCQQAIETVDLNADDWIVETVQDDQLNETSTQQSKAPKFTPVSFHGECIKKVEMVLGLDLERKTLSTYSNIEGTLGLICSVSKEYQRGTLSEYWFAFHPTYREFLRRCDKSYVCFGCGSEQTTLLIPFDRFEQLLDKMWTTTKEDTMYWHVKIFKQNENLLIGLPTKEAALDITQYLI
jgi:hypothetical protein